MLKTQWLKKGAFIVPYGTMSAVELSLTDIMSKMVVDDWGQCKSGQFGSLRAEAGKLSEATLYAESSRVAIAERPTNAAVVLRLAASPSVSADPVSRRPMSVMSTISWVTPRRVAQRRAYSSSLLWR
jgi:ornithine cyclodeaminase/alanine dehydrogenase-like protein (mu-crystallin family)